MATLSWTNKTDGVDDIHAEDFNTLASEANTKFDKIDSNITALASETNTKIEEVNTRIDNISVVTVDQTYLATSENAQSGIAVTQAFTKNYITTGRKSGTTLGEKATAEGLNTTASGLYAHAEGRETTASSQSAHAEGYNTVASNQSAHAEGKGTSASAVAAHAEGSGTAASANYAHAEGENSKAQKQSSHAEGCATTASGYNAHTEGNTTVAQGTNSHAEGDNTAASGFSAHSQGSGTIARGDCSNSGGLDSVASGDCSNATGSGTIANTFLLNAQGQYNTESAGEKGTYSATQNAYVIGNGTSNTARANCFRVDFSGNVYGLSAYNSTGADYAEYFEWEDGNPNGEDRVGKFVTLTSGGKIRLANSTDEILGIISGTAGIVGDSYEDSWAGMYDKDKFGRLIYEDVEVIKPAIIDFEGEILEPERIVIEKRIKMNPGYDSTRTYIPRSKRKEWACVGVLGKLILIDNGTCTVGSKCDCGSDGIATAGEKYTVIERIDNTTIRIWLK